MRTSSILMMAILIAAPAFGAQFSKYEQQEMTAPIYQFLAGFDTVAGKRAISPKYIKAKIPEGAQWVAGMPSPPESIQIKKVDPPYVYVETVSYTMGNEKITATYKFQVQQENWNYYLVPGKQEQIGVSLYVFPYLEVKEVRQQQ